MNGSSGDPADVLAKVRPQQVFLLLEILREVALPQREHVSARYSERARHFLETVQFAQSLGWVRPSGQALQMIGGAPARILGAPAATRPMVFAEALAETSGPYQLVLARHLSRFELGSEGLSYQPTGELRLTEAPARDFLMALGAIVHRADRGIYILTPPFAFLRLWARNVRGLADLVPLGQRAQDQAQLGHEAELAVLEWEKRRVGGDAAERVRHIAAENPVACYDIQSLTMESDGECPRFIEVKAVSQGTHEFHWSAAEIEAAQILGDRYFLYLAPVLAARRFDLDNLQIIQNPFVTIYQNPALWLKEEATIVCRRKNASAT